MFCAPDGGCMFLTCKHNQLVIADAVLPLSVLLRWRTKWTQMHDYPDLKGVLMFFFCCCHICCTYSLLAEVRASRRKKSSAPGLIRILYQSHEHDHLLYTNNPKKKPPKFYKAKKKIMSVTACIGFVKLHKNLGYQWQRNLWCGAMCSTSVHTSMQPVIFEVQLIVN